MNNTYRAMRALNELEARRAANEPQDDSDDAAEYPAFDDTVPMLPALLRPQA